MRLSIFVCVYNEHSSVLGVLDRVAAVDLGPGWEKEVIVVDNCSTDGTRELLQGLRRPGVRVIYHPRNLGKGSSVRTAIAHMTGDYGVIQDADSEYDPADLPRLLRAAAREGAAAVFGSRVLGGHVRYKYAHTYLGVRFLTAVTNLLFGSRLTDVATATKMVRADLLKSLNLVGTGFDLDFELVDKILLTGHVIREVEISYNPRTYEEGKKIRAKDGLIALGVILRDRLGLSAALRRREGRESQEMA